MMALRRCSAICYAPSVYAIYALYPFQLFLIGIHGALVAFVSEPRIALLSIVQIHDRIPNISQFELNAHTHNKHFIKIPKFK